MSEIEHGSVVLVDERRLGEAWVEQLTAACQEARVERRVWRGEHQIPGGGRPVLLVSALANGERRIPDDLVTMMTQRFPGLPLLLLVRDELVRPVVSLQEGRVTLLGPPLSTRRIAARVRLLVAEQRDDSLASQTDVYGQAQVLTFQHSTPVAYYGYAACVPEAARPEDTAPLVEGGTNGGFRALLSLDGPPPAQAIEKLAPVDDEDDEDRERRFAEALGPAVGTAALAGNTEWSFYWPTSSFGLWLASPVRLPRLWCFSDSLSRTGTSFLRLSAAAGDVAIGVWGVPWATAEVPRAEREKQLLEAALAGGPLVLDTLVEWLRHLERPAIGFVAEVR